MAVKIEPGSNNKVIIWVPYDQELFGYKISKITEIYTHVSKTSLAKTKNPLDNIMKEET